ncbi:hypothetical protein [Photobacterium chitinilyticum]|uniref:Uncharacterized protein n=1 Tax=Photobacterium chitinilyticum TaxID=2485123 RepID=A0A444JT64_9GAMM|nr:hypothetical protein [Photobacterium chitinilyticum]RWX56225.1 hypothetical protein EDI28_08050 [Photobacterium chitinilyticum]
MQNENEKLDNLEPKSLEQILVSLQKSISRVNESSSSVAKDRARALIIGDLNFELDLKCNLEADKLKQSNDGGISINLKGTINTDIQVIGGSGND